LEDLVKYAVSTATNLGAQYAEARFQRNEGLRLGFKNGVPDPAGFVKKSGIAIRVLANGALGFACTNTMTRESVRSSVESAYRTAKMSARLVKSPIRMAGVSSSKANWAVKARVPLEDTSVEEQMEVLKETEKAVTSTPLNMKLVARFFELMGETEEKIFVNSEGAMIHGTVPRLRFFTLLTGVSDKGSIQRWYTKGQSGGWEVMKQWNIAEATLDEAKTMSEILEKAEKPPNDEVDMVLGSEIVGIICHESCGHPQEADRILGREAAQAGESYLKPNMLGFNVGSEQVTVVDDPTLPNSYGYYDYDDEGVKAHRRVLIDHGKIAGFLHNRETAAELNTDSNASSRSVGFDREPIVRMANTYMEPGDHSFEELLEDVRHGVFMKTFMEWNIDDKRYNERYVGHEAYLVENGELKNFVRNPTLEITTPGLYGSVDAAGKDMMFDAGTCGKGDPSQGAPVYEGGPSIRLREIRLGGAA
jgi:TldD protein